MKICAVINPELVDKYVSTYELDPNLVRFILGRTNGNFVETNPNTGKISKLFSKLAKFYGSSSTAAKAKAYLYSDEFRSMYGDWLSEEVQDLLDLEDSEPTLKFQIRYTTKNNVSKSAIGKSPLEALVKLLNTETARDLYTIQEGLGTHAEAAVSHLLDKYNVSRGASTEQKRSAIAQLMLKEFSEHQLQLPKSFSIVPGFSNNPNTQWIPLQASNEIALDQIFPYLSETQFPDHFVRITDGRLSNNKFLYKLDSGTKTIRIAKNATLELFKESLFIDPASLYNETTRNRERAIIYQTQIQAARRSAYEELLKQFPDLERVLQDKDTFQNFLMHYVNSLGNICLDNTVLNQLSPSVQLSAMVVAATLVTQGDKAGMSSEDLFDLRYMPQSKLGSLMDAAEAESADWQAQMNSRELEYLLREAGTSKEAFDILSEDNEYLQVFKKILGSNFINSTLEFSQIPIVVNGKSTDASFDPGTNTITIYTGTDRQAVEVALMHEILHAQTYYTIRKDPKLFQRAEDIRQRAIDALCQRYNCSLEQLDAVSGKKLYYYLNNSDEFLSGVWTEDDLIDELQTLGSPRKTLLDELIDLFKMILNKRSGIYDDASELLIDILKRNTNYIRFSSSYGKSFLLANNLIEYDGAEKLGHQPEIEIPHVEIRERTELLIKSIDNGKQYVREHPDTSIYTLRPGVRDLDLCFDGNPKHNFGNPFGTALGCTVLVEGVKEATDAYTAWLYGAEGYILPPVNSSARTVDFSDRGNRVVTAYNSTPEELAKARSTAVKVSILAIEPETRAFVVKSLYDGLLIGKTLVYYTKKPHAEYNTYGRDFDYETAPCHAHVLLKAINQVARIKFAQSWEAQGKLPFKIKEDTSTDPIDVWFGNGVQHPLSNLSPRPFVMGGIQFKNVEQFFQWRKAHEIQKAVKAANGHPDSIQQLEEIKAQILAARTGSEAKRLGSKVPFYDLIRDSWESNTRTDVMRQGMYQSFIQNPHSLVYLLSTGNRKITHNNDRGIWNSLFPLLLEEVRASLKTEFVDLEWEIDQAKEKLNSHSETIKNQKEIKAEFAAAEGDNGERFTDTVKALKQGLPISNITPFFTPEEAELVKQSAAGNGKINVQSVSRHTDPAFFADELVGIIRLQKQYELNDPRRIQCVDIWSKHDGMPIVKILKACQESRVAPLLQFSISTLGNSKFEPGVMKYEDLLDRIEQILKLGLIQPEAVKIRIDPIIPGVTNINDVREVISRARALGITQFSTSMLQSYGHTKDPYIVNKMVELGYDWTQYYDADFNIQWHVSNLPRLKSEPGKPNAYLEWRQNFQTLLSEFPDITITSCAVNGLGLPEASCLDPEMVESILGTDINKSIRTAERSNVADGAGGTCRCYGHGDLLEYTDRCESSCGYCYAHQGNETPIRYYNDNGELLENQYTQVNPEDYTGQLESYAQHSGGAVGSDSMWDVLGKQFGVISYHYYYGKRTPYGNSEISESDFEEGKLKVELANLTLKRVPDAHMDLLARNWILVKNSDGIFAIGKIQNDLIVDGGTGWAVQMAIDDLSNTYRPIYVFDLASNTWKVWDNETRLFLPYNGGTPILTKNFAGIGTRRLNKKAVAAINRVYTQTVSELNNINDKECNKIKFVVRYDPTDQWFDETFLPGIYVYDISKREWYKGRVPESVGMFDKLIYNADNALVVKEVSDFLKASEGGTYFGDVWINLALSKKDAVNIQKYREKMAKVHRLRPSWTDAQSLAIKDISKKILSSRSGDVYTVIGKAGTGKTTIVGKILSEIRAESVVCTTVSHEAKRNIEEKILQTFDGQAIDTIPMSLASLLGKTAEDNFEVSDIKVSVKNLSKVNVLVIDEASQLNKSDVDAITETVRRVNQFRPADNQLNVIVLGDDGQTKPIPGASEEIGRYDYLPGLAMSSSDNTYHLTERVRQGEGSAILDLADIYHTLATKKGEEITKQDHANFYNGILNTLTTIQDTNAILTAQYNPDDITSMLRDPGVVALLKKAIELDDPNYFHFVTYFVDYTQNLNNMTRRFVLEQFHDIHPDKEDFRRYFPNEWLMITSEGCTAQSETEGEVTLTNGTKIKVLDCSEVLRHELGFNYVTLTAVEFGPSGRKLTITARCTDKETTRNFPAVLRSIKDKRDRYKIRTQFPALSQCFALNVNKAQGQTYQIAYIPVHEYVTTSDRAQRGFMNVLGVTANQNGWQAGVVDTSAAFYTALTRAANITILGGTPAMSHIGEYTKSVPEDVVALNDNIVKNRNASQSPIEEAQKAVAKTVLNVEPKKSGGHSLEDFGKMTTHGSNDLQFIKDFMDYVTGDPYYFSHFDQNKDYYQLLSKLFMQRELELEHFGHTFGLDVPMNDDGSYDFASVIKDPNVLFTEFTKETAANYPGLINREVQDAQIMLPKMHENAFRLGSRSLSEIDKSFFKNRDYYYRSQVTGQDLIIRTPVGLVNVAFRTSVLNTPENTRDFGELYNPVTDDDNYVIDKDGNQLFKLPKNAQLFNKNGDITIVVKSEFNTADGQNKIMQSFNQIVDSFVDIVSIQPLCSNMTDALTIRKMVDRSIKKSSIKFMESDLRNAANNNTVEEKKKHLFNIYNNRKHLRTYNDHLSNVVYESFVRALPVIAARIPTQAFASWMRMQQTAYLPNQQNNAFVSRWQLWLQGSDLDIDKVYIMGHAITDLGLYEHWSPLAKQVSNSEQAKYAEDLPIPNNIKIILQDDPNAFADVHCDLLLVTTFGKDAELLNLIAEYKQQVRRIDKFRVLVDIVNWFNTNKSFDITPELVTDKDVKHIVKLLNLHNISTVSTGALTNMEFLGMSRVITDARNMISKQTTIDNAMSDIRQYLDEIKDSTPSSAYNGLSIYRLEEANQTGKKVVGVMANALKAFACITQCMNINYAKGNGFSEEDPNFFLNSITLNGKTYNMTTIANAKLRSEQFAQLEELAKSLTDGEFDELLRTGILRSLDKEELMTNFKDVSIILGAFTSMATDNAKELGLAKVHASINLASMHCYLAMMGVPVKDIVEYTAKSNIFTRLYELTLANGWDNANGSVTSYIWDLLLKEAKTENELRTLQATQPNTPIQELGFTKDDVAQLRRLYNFAQEVKSFTRKLGINQGLKTGEADTIHFINDFKDTISDQFERFVEPRDLLINQVLDALDNDAILTEDRESFTQAALFNVLSQMGIENERLGRGTVKSIIKSLITKFDHNKGLARFIPKLIIKNIKDSFIKMKQSRILKEDLIRCYFKMHGLPETENLLNLVINKVEESYDDLILMTEHGIDFTEFFTNPTYQERAIKALDLIKGTINSLNIITNTPHFYEMFRGAAIKLKDAADACARERYLLHTAYDIFKTSKVKMRYLYPRKSMSIKDIKKIDRFFDDYIISQFSISPELRKFLHFSYRKSSDAADIKVDITEENGLEQFKDFINLLIPRLKNKLLSKNNAFVERLIPRNISKEKGKYKLLYELVDYDANDLHSGNEETANEARMVVAGFDAIQALPVSLFIGYENAEESEYKMTIGDALYLYDLLFNLNQFGVSNLSDIFNGDYILKDVRPERPVLEKEKFYLDYDLGTRQVEIDDAMFMAFLYQDDIKQALRTATNIDRSYGDSNYTPNVDSTFTVNGKSYTVTDAYLWNRAGSIKSNSTLKKFELFKQALKDHVLDIKIECI